MSATYPWNFTPPDSVMSPFEMGNALVGTNVFGGLILLAIFAVTTFGVAGSKGGDIASGAGFGGLLTFIIWILALPFGIFPTYGYLFIFIAIGSMILSKKP